jgi:hypothetical protein
VGTSFYFLGLPGFKMGAERAIFNAISCVNYKIAWPPEKDHRLQASHPLGMTIEWFEN